MSEPLFKDVEFDVEHDHMLFNTQTNGDVVKIIGLNLGPDKAAAVAYLVNQPKALTIEIKIKE